MESDGVDAAFVVAEDGAYRGEICREEARNAAANGNGTIEHAVSRRCEPVLASQCLEDALSKAWPYEGKVPVVDDEERLVGMVERDVLAEAVFSEEREEDGA